MFPSVHTDVTVVLATLLALYIFLCLVTPIRKLTCRNIKIGQKFFEAM